MDAPKAASPSVPARIAELVTAARAARVLTAAVALGVFDRLAQGPASAGPLAAALGADARALEVLLDALAALGFLAKRGGVYSNTEEASRSLVTGAPGSLASNLRYQELLAGAWADLPEVVRRGAPVRDLSALLSGDPDFNEQYIRGMADISRGPAAELAGALNLAGCRAMLDVGGGPGVYACAMLERERGLRAVLLDLPSTLSVAAGLLEGSPLKERLELRPGDYHRADFGRGEFDLVLLSHVTHDEGEAENRALLAKAAQALRPGGRVVVHDFMVRSDRAGPPFPALFGVHMLVYTAKGRTYSAEEYERWLGEAGLEVERRLDIAAGTSTATRAVVAVKPR